MGVTIVDALYFAEWMDLNAVRSNKHEWTYMKDLKSTKKYSTNEMFELYRLVQTELPF